MLTQLLSSHPRCPWLHGRSTNIFLKVQSRLMTPVMVTIILSVVGLELAGGTGGEQCWAQQDKQLGGSGVVSLCRRW